MPINTLYALLFGSLLASQIFEYTQTFINIYTHKHIHTSVIPSSLTQIKHIIFQPSAPDNI